MSLKMFYLYVPNFSTSRGHRMVENKSDNENTIIVL
jgi:hypothetical protein